MKLHNNVGSLFSRNYIKAGTSVQSIKEGQILTGKVIKFYPSNMALIETNGMKLMAEAEMKLLVNQKYLFQAIKKNDKIQLKLLQQGSHKGLVNDLTGLTETIIKHGNLSNSKPTQLVIGALLNEDIPFTESELLSITKWIDGAKNIPRAVDTIRTLVKANIPIIKGSLEGIYAFLDEEPMSSQLLNLQQQLTEHPFRNHESIAKLMAMVDDLLNFDPIEQLVKNERKGPEVFNQIMKNLGVGGNQEDNLKTMLLTALTTVIEDRPLFEQIERLTQRVTGMQLFTQEIGHSQQVVLQFPLKLRDFLTDMTVQWSSQKNSDGKIDPDFCHILFYLELQHIGNTVIDMKIQHRVLNLTIYNKTDYLAEAINQFKPMLKRNLEKQGYILSNVKLTVPQHEKVGIKALLLNPISNNISGVDLKI